MSKYNVDEIKKFASYMVGKYNLITDMMARAEEHAEEAARLERPSYYSYHMKMRGELEEARSEIGIKTLLTRYKEGPYGVDIDRYLKLEQDGAGHYTLIDRRQK